MNNQLKQFIATYEACNAFQTMNQKETLMSHEIPNRPWSKVGSDIFEWRREHYLVLVDYYSNLIEFDLTRNQTPAEIINLMQKQFARWGIPEDIVTDNGTNYDSVESSQFCKRNNIKHTESSPHHCQSNGNSESAVKIVKTLLRKTKKTTLNPYETLLSRHNTPITGMTTSSAQRFLNRRQEQKYPSKELYLHRKLQRKC